MTNKISNILKARGLKVDEKNYHYLNSFWEDLNNQRKELDQDVLKEKNIALVSCPGGDHIE